MKVKTLSALAGIGATMILSGEANAAFTGLTVVKHTTVTISAVSRDVYRVYANFDNANDAVQAVFGGVSPIGGLGGSPLSIENVTAGGGVGSGFFNGGTDNCPFGTSTQSIPGPGALWGTFASIGAWLGGPAAPSVVQTSNTFSLVPAVQFISGTSLTNNNIGWYHGGPTPQAVTSSTLDGSATSVGLMQLTVNAGEHVRGTINIQYDPGSPLAGGVTGAIGVTFNSVPAPGALALLGLAGLVGSRRRRA